MEEENEQLANILNQKFDKISLQDVIGLEAQKKFLLSRLSSNQKDNRHTLSGNVLIFGAPGIGKSFLTKAIASTLQIRCFRVFAHDFIIHHGGNPELIIKSLFSTARKNKPSLIILEQMESLPEDSSSNNTWSSLKKHLVEELGRVDENEGVTVFGVTQAPWKMESYLLKLFEQKLLFTFPNQNDKFQLMKQPLNKSKVVIEEQSLRQFVKQIPGASCSDILVLIRDAQYEPIRKLQKATRFRKLENGKWKACKGQEQGQENNLMNFQQNELEIQSVNYDDLMQARKRWGVSIEESYAQKYIDWALEQKATMD